MVLVMKYVRYRADWGNTKTHHMNNTLFPRLSEAEIQGECGNKYVSLFKNLSKAGLWSYLCPYPLPPTFGPHLQASEVAGQQAHCIPQGKHSGPVSSPCPAFPSLLRGLQGGHGQSVRRSSAGSHVHLGAGDQSIT